MFTLPTLRVAALKPTNIERYLPDTDAAAKVHHGREKLYCIFFSNVHSSIVVRISVFIHFCSFLSHETLLLHMFLYICFVLYLFIYFYLSIMFFFILFIYLFFVFPLLFFVRGMDVMAAITVSTWAIKLKGIHPSGHISTQTFFTTALTTLSSIKIED